ncbi:hypothetical protein QR680_000806 [Steinernema hermaphroditum]|uniref:FAD dependent oxidoreductase domain-containing protein n=1 Tax=Steinernema hermaphroditum TaxID=289476 RepID=A0AA39GVZ7_9BILA|nr:hypothetical protein QR680_000806 [Steinernema hermaphroditum]
MAKNIHDVLILGAGIMGSCTAYHSARASLRPLVFEQFAKGHANGSSHGQSRIIRYSHGDGTYLPIMKESYGLWDELEKATGERLINKCGLLRVSTSEVIVKKYAKILGEYGAKHYLLKGDEIHKAFPHFHYRDGWFGVVDVEGGIIFAENCMKAAQMEAVRHGAVFNFEEKVEEIQRETDCVNVVTNKGVYSCKNLVVTAGGWLNKVLPGFNTFVHTQAEQIGTLYWTIKSNNEQFDADKNCPVVVIEEEDAKMFMLPPVDYPNQIKLCLDECVPIDPDHPLDKMPEAMQEVVGRHISKYIPDVDGSKPSKIDLCVYTMTNDSHYAIGKYPTDPRILVAGGFSGSGFKLAISVGRMLTDIAQGADERATVPELFSLTRKRAGKH